MKIETYHLDSWELEEIRKVIPKSKKIDFSLDNFIEENYRLGWDEENKVWKLSLFVSILSRMFVVTIGGTGFNKDGIEYKSKILTPELLNIAKGKLLLEVMNYPR